MILTNISKSVCDTARRGARDALYCLFTFLRRFIDAQRTVIYDVVIVSRNLARTNQNDGFKMTALELLMNSKSNRCKKEAHKCNSKGYKKAVSSILTYPFLP